MLNQMRPLQNIYRWNFESAASVPKVEKDNLILGLNLIGFANHKVEILCERIGFSLVKKPWVAPVEVVVL